MGAVLCMLLVFAIFPLLLWRRRSDAAASASADNDRLPPQPLQEDQVLHGRAAPRRMRRRPGAASSSAASTSRDGTRTAKTPVFLPPIACVLTLASVLRGAVPEDEEGDDEEVPDAPRSSKKKEKKRQEREAQRQVGCSLQCCVLSWAPTSAYLASHRLLNCVPLIGTSHCNFGCTGRFSSSTVCTSVCSYPNSVYLFIYGLHILLLSWFTHSVPGSSQLTIID